MQSIELRIHGAIPPDEVLYLLHRPDSGIKQTDSGLGSHFRESRSSVVGDVITYAGIIVSIVQLAATIFQIYQSQRSKATEQNKPKPVQISIITNKGPLNVPDATSAEIELTIEQYVTNTT
jgi:hypothetical protein